MNKIITKCPVCGGEMTATRLHCMNCDTRIEGQFLTGSNPFAVLTPEQLNYVVTFVRCEGRLNRMEEEMKMSYPTLRSRLVEIVRALGYEPGKDEPAPKLSAEERRKILEDLDTGAITWEEAQVRLSGQRDEPVEAEPEEVKDSKESKKTKGGKEG